MHKSFLIFKYKYVLCCVKQLSFNKVQKTKMQTHANTHSYSDPENQNLAAAYPVLKNIIAEKQLLTDETAPLPFHDYMDLKLVSVVPYYLPISLKDSSTSHTSYNYNSRKQHSVKGIM